MTKPHPTNPDYEYVYYYDYDEEEEDEKEEREAAPDNAVKTTQSSPPSTRTSPSSRVCAMRFFFAEISIYPCNFFVITGSILHE